MKILSITAQKPSSTGSGIYLSELVKGFARQGHEQAVIAGVYREDIVELPEKVQFYPVYFRTESLPFAIAGMSDEMPYESTVYGEMTEEMEMQFGSGFRAIIRQAKKAFTPDVVICHHLYLVTALAREIFTDTPVFGFCHNTDLRQMKKIPLARTFIKERIRRLDRIFAIHEEQKAEIVELYGVEEACIRIIGTGYNDEIFYRTDEENEANRMDITDEANRTRQKTTEPVRLIFAGKLSEKKGVMSLLRSLSCLRNLQRSEDLEKSSQLDSEASREIRISLTLAGGYGNEEEYREIRELAKRAPCPVTFLGSISQTELAKEYNKADIFVLPSFCEGIPLTVIEAMACGDKVVITDLPGIQNWIREKVPNAPVVYVTPPKMKNTDEPIRASLSDFEQELAMKIQECIKLKAPDMPDMSGISWGNICRAIEEEARCL